MQLSHSFKMAPVNGDVKWRCVIVCAILSVLLFERTVCVYTYDCKDLLHILQTVYCEYRPKLLYFSDDLSRDNTQTHTKGRTFQRDSTHRRSRKRGRRAGVLTRFRRRNLRPPLPAIVLALCSELTAVVVCSLTSIQEARGKRSNHLLLSLSAIAQDKMKAIKTQFRNCT